MKINTYYVGGLITISAITLFMTHAWDTLRGWPLLLLSALLFGGGLYLVRYFLKRKLRTPASLLATFSLLLVPLMTYNLQILIGLVPPDPYLYSDFHFWTSWYWIPMEVTTLATGLILFYIYRFSFLLLPIAITIWYLSLDLWMLSQPLRLFSWSDRGWVSLYVGSVITIAAWLVDSRRKRNGADFAFWLYIVGVTAAWIGLTSLECHSEWGKLLYGLINVAMIVMSLVLNRRIFAVLGTIGVLMYVGHLAFSVFRDSVGFPLILIVLGVAIIFITMWQKKIKGKLKKIWR
jgi:hypothetical protein